MSSGRYQALNLAERIALPPATGSDPLFDEEAARFRLRKWRSQQPFVEPDLFAWRLAADGLSEADFLALLGQSGSYLEARCVAPASWLARAGERLPEAGALAPPFVLPACCPPEPAAAFLQVVAPVLSGARRAANCRLQRLLDVHPGAPIERATAEALLFRSLPVELLWILNQTMVLEMHVAALAGGLAGDSPQTRFCGFAAGFRDPHRSAALFEEYPVLERLLRSRIDQWYDVGVELLARLSVDWPAIVEEFAQPKASMLDRIEFSAGDQHCGGRNVAILHFPGGFRLVYKPRPPAVQAHFNDLLRWIAERGGPALRPVRILARPTHSWGEFIARQPCESAAAAESFYQRQGSTLALLHALCATDFHSENLIAAGEHPVLIDLESLFGPQAPADDEVEGQVSGELVVGSSVLAVGLLPRRIREVGDRSSFEFSGLGGRGGQRVTSRLAVWEAAGTDQMRLVRRPGWLRGFLNLPELDGGELNAADYAEPLVRGFAAMYDFLTAHRQELLAEGGPVAAFAGDEVRIVLRPTVVYSRLLSESHHPDLLRHAMDRERHFDRLWFGLQQLPAGQRERLPQIVAAERRDLWNGDVPYFKAEVGELDLIDSAGQRQRGFFAISGADAVRRRLLAFDARDRELQLRFVRGSLATMALDRDGFEGGGSPAAGSRGAGGPANREAFLEAAARVGDRLAELAIRSTREATWVGVALRGAAGWEMVPLGLDLYSGVPGIALFLACLGKATGERRYGELAEAAWRTVTRTLASNGQEPRSLGGYEGWGGMIYGMTILALLWERRELLHSATTLVDRVWPLIEQDRQLDVIGGCAGCIAALLALHRAAPNDSLAAAATRCGERLVSSATAQATGVGWPSRFADGGALTGFAHGAAGIAWALLQLGVVTGDDRFRQTADAAFAFERSVFDSERNNWPDLRNATSGGGAGSHAFMTAWCSGAPGVGLSRLEVLRAWPDGALRDEIEAALQATKRRGFGNNLSLCHGDLGNIELFARAGRWLDGHWQAEAENLSAGILDAIAARGFRCGVPQGIETPGLMVGLAGIGLGLLRLANPGGTPCVLLLEEPGVDRAGGALSVAPGPSHPPHA